MQNDPFGGCLIINRLAIHLQNIGGIERALAQIPGQATSHLVNGADSTTVRLHVLGQYYVRLQSSGTTMSDSTSSGSTMSDSTSSGSTTSGSPRPRAVLRPAPHVLVLCPAPRPLAVLLRAPRAAVNITASASDPSGIASITILGDELDANGYLNTTACSATWQGKKITQGTHTITERLP